MPLDELQNNEMHPDDLLKNTCAKVNPDSESRQAFYREWLEAEGYKIISIQVKSIVFDSKWYEDITHDVIYDFGIKIEDGKFEFLGLKQTCSLLQRMTISALYAAGLEREPDIDNVDMTDEVNIIRVHQAHSRGVETTDPRDRHIEAYVIATEHAELHQAIQELTPSLKEAIIGQYFRGETAEQTAYRLGCTAGAIRSNRHHARTQLRRLLSKAG